MRGSRKKERKRVYVYDCEREKENLHNDECQHVYLILNVLSHTSFCWECVRQDYEPSSDHLGVFSNALTYMLVQVRQNPEKMSHPFSK